MPLLFEILLLFYCRVKSNKIRYLLSKHISYTKEDVEHKLLLAQNDPPPQEVLPGAPSHLIQFTNKFVYSGANLSY